MKTTSITFNYCKPPGEQHINLYVTCGSLFDVIAVGEPLELHKGARDPMQVATP